MNKSVFNIYVLLIIITSVCVNPKSFGYVGDQDYDFSWLDPDKKIYVLQNRRYRKAKRFEFVLGPDIRLNNTLVSAYGASGRLMYYLNEEWGIDAFYKHKFNRKSSAAEHFEDQTGFKGLSRQVNYYGGLELVWVPLYAKINTFNHIFYIDWGFSGGMAWVETEADRNLFKGIVQANSIETTTTPGVTGNTFMKFFVSEHFGIRHDIQVLMYRADQVTPVNSTKARGTNTLMDWEYNLNMTILF